MHSKGWQYAATYTLITSGRPLNPMPTTEKVSGTTQSEVSNSTSATATSVLPKQARSGRSSLPAVRPSHSLPSNVCIPTYQGQKLTTITLTVQATAGTSHTSFGVGRQPSAGAETNSENLANSKAKDDEAQVQARMDSLMMVITTLCDCIGAVDDSNSPNAFAVKMKIVDKIDELIDKIEY
jgi:cytoskeletal protein RodZ